MAEPTSLVEVVSIPDSVQANLIKVHLGQAGITAILFDDFAKRGIIGETSCPSRNMVRSNDLPAARQIVPGYLEAGG